MICAQDHMSQRESWAQAPTSGSSFLFSVPTAPQGTASPAWPHVLSFSLPLNIFLKSGQRGRGEGKKQTMSFLPVHSMDMVHALLSGMCSETALSFHFFIPIPPEAPREGSS